MRIIVGFGNQFRGEDGFGIEVIKELEKHPLKETKLLSVFQLTPELSLELQDASEIIFVDAGYSQTDQYSLACNVETKINSNLSHHIGVEMIISMINNLYNKFPHYEVYSMLTNSFETIQNRQKYSQNIKKVTKYIKKL